MAFESKDIYNERKIFNSVEYNRVGESKNFRPLTPPGKPFGTRRFKFILTVFQIIMV